MYLARSFLKNVSTTTALPIADAGQMKKAVKALHTAIEAYEFVFAQAILNTRLPIREMMKIGLRPKRVDKGRQNRGPPPMIAIWSEVRYDACCRSILRSWATFS